MLFQLLDAHTARRARELHEQGSVQAIAAHDPKRLSELELRPPLEDKPVRDWFDAYVRK